MNRWRDRSGLFAKILVSGIGTIVLISLLWLWALNYFLGKSSQADARREAFSTITVDLYAMRIVAKDIVLRDLTDDAFYTKGESAGIRTYHEKYEVLREAVARAMDTPGVDVAVVKRIQELQERYETIFKQLLAKYRALGFRNWGLRGEWSREGADLKQLIDKSSNFSLLKAYNDLLSNEYEYLDTPNQKYVARAQEILERMRGLTDSLLRGQRAPLQDAVNRYGELMRKHWALLQEIGVERGEGLRGMTQETGRGVLPLANQEWEASIHASREAREQLKKANLAIMALGVALGAIIFFILSRIISRPLATATAVAQRIAAGDLRVDLEGLHARNVLGMALRSMVENLTTQVREIKEGAASLGSSTTEISAAVTQVTASATETATAVTQTMATAEELRQTSELSAQKAGHVSRTAAESSGKSAEGQKALAQINLAMAHIRTQMEAIGASVVALSEQGQVIGEIIGTVDDLAEQSNILSVNASIEAAKAGEHGRGFAVVAQEIKSLAEKSKEGTARVRAILADIQKATSSAVMVAEQGAKAVETGEAQVEEAGRAMHALGESIVNVDQAAVQILASSKQQFSGVEQVTAAIENIRDATEQNVRSMEQLEATADFLAAIGSKIIDQMAWYKI